jgi:hypothetical protein
MHNSDVMTTFKAGNFDSINYRQTIGFDIEDMHYASVRYHKQLKTIENHKSIVDNEFD